mmetsp:Transcript_144109/g.461335  ORF Transcript_144109/g.461335 Transcript_144109/m.461335 type:complete len:227 (-) Transcript_144109:745-1425(-)
MHRSHVPVLPWKLQKAKAAYTTLQLRMSTIELMADQVPTASKIVVHDGDEADHPEYFRQDERVLVEHQLHQAFEGPSHAKEAQHAQCPEYAKHPQCLADLGDLSSVHVRSDDSHDRHNPIEAHKQGIQEKPCGQVAHCDLPRPHLQSTLSVVAHEKGQGDVHTPNGQGEVEHEHGNLRFLYLEHLQWDDHNLVQQEGDAYAVPRQPPAASRMHHKDAAPAPKVTLL